MIFKKYKIEKLIFVSISILTLLFVVNKGVVLQPDTNAYFGMWIYVSAGYPFFLRGLQFLFGDNYSVAAVAIQFIVLLISIYIFVFHFLTRFHLKSYQIILMILMLFYPIYDENIYAINNITTEGLSLAIFLQVVYISYLVFTTRRLKNYLLLLILTVVLISIRGQFQFLIPIFIAVEILLWWKEKQLKWKHYILILLIPVITFTADNVYHKIIHKQYFSTPFSFTAMLTAVAFVADDSDVQYLKTEEEKTVFKRIKSKYKEKGIAREENRYAQESIEFEYFFYHTEFPRLCNQTLQGDVITYYMKGKKKEDVSLSYIVEACVNAEKMNKKLFFNLLPHTFGKWFNLVFQNFKTGIGGAPVVFLYLISLILLLKRYLEKKESIVLFSIFLLLSILANSVLISVSIHGLTRYLFYTHWIPIFLLFLGVNRLSVQFKN